MNDVITKNINMWHMLIDSYLESEDISIDATCGNGNDTLYLAQRSSEVYAFDIQEKAVKATADLLSAHDLKHKVRIFCSSHHLMATLIPEDAKAGCIVFNLGYLPGSDKSVTTTGETSIQAVKTSLNLLRKGGLCLITMYSGHPGGKEEKNILLKMAEGLDKSRFHCLYFNLVNQPDNPPEILAIVKKK